LHIDGNFDTGFQVLASENKQRSSFMPTSTWATEPDYDQGRSGLCAPRLVFISELTPQPLKEKYMHVTAARPASRKVIGTWLAYWRIFPLVLAANAITATLAWMFVGLLMK
jgi:hypothetical protein